MLRKKAKKKGRLKRIVTGLLALAVALLVAGYAMIASLDVQQVAAFAKQQVKAATGRELTVDGPVKLQIALTPSFDLQDVAFANAPWGSRAEMVSLRRLEVEVELLPLLFGKVVVKRLVVVEPDILLETDPEGRGNWVFQETSQTTAPVESAADSDPVTLPDVQDFRIEGGRLVFVDAASGESLQLDVAEALGAVPAGGGARSLHLEAAYNGNPFTLDVTYAGLPALLSGTPGPIDLTLIAGGATLTVKGSAGNLAEAPQADVVLTAKGDSLAGLSPFAGVALPALGPYDLSAKVKGGTETIDISNLALQVGGSDLGGNVTVTLTGERPSAKAQFVSKVIDLADFSAPETASAGAGSDGTGIGGGRVFPDEPLPLEGLRAVDGQAKLSLAKLHLTPKMTLDEVDLTAKLTGGDLTVEPLAALLAGGPLKGRLALTASKAEPDLGLSLTGSDIDLGDLLTRAEVSDQVGGKLALDVDLLGHGASPHAIAAGLGGKVQAVSRDGTIDNALLSAFSAGLSDITGPLFGGSESARLECFVARFDVAEGQARSRALVLDTGAFAVSGRGGIDLDSERVDLAFDTETSEPSLASLAAPFKVTGPLANPSVQPDAVGAALGAVDSVGNVAEGGANIVGGAVNSVGSLVGTGPLVGRVGSNESLCGAAYAALDEAGDGAVAPAGSGSGSGSGSKVLDDVGDALDDAGRSIEQGIKNLFGN